FTLALWDRWQAKWYILANARLFWGLAVGSLAINAVLLVVLIFSYGHRGVIEPVLRLSKADPSARVMYLHPEMRGWVPVQYGPSTMNNVEIRNWEEWEALRADGLAAQPPDYFVLYPCRTDSLSACVDSVEAQFGRVEPVFQVNASPYDWVLHTLNPRHNPSYEGWVYRRSGVQALDM
ncbi:MAG: hypothetical protein HY851_08820, partial [candidate division Zixibacteria bacterium]|nr:hypothetical protein [candidate division Zixibacteria bacterium]